MCWGVMMEIRTTYRVLSLLGLLYFISEQLIASIGTRDCGALDDIYNTASHL